VACHLEVERAEGADLAFARRNRLRAEVPRTCRFVPSKPSDKSVIWYCMFE
jgi:hypothetical protein